MTEFDSAIEEMKNTLELELSAVFDAAPKELWIVIAEAIQESVNKVCDYKKRQGATYMDAEAKKYAKSLIERFNCLIDGIGNH